MPQGSLQGPKGPGGGLGEPLGGLWGGLTRILAPLAALDEAEDEEDEEQQHHGADEADEPALRGKAARGARQNWGGGSVWGSNQLWGHPPERPPKCPGSFGGFPCTWGVKGGYRVPPWGRERGVRGL